MTNIKKWISEQVNIGCNRVHATPCTLTPELAEELLTRNIENRNISQRRVEIYADDIKAGRWAENGETIVVSREGLLNDGQHRCAAVLASGCSIPAMIVFGVERDTRTTTNQGKAKGAADYASMRGIANATHMAAISRLAIAYECGYHIETSKITHSAVLDYIDKHQDELAQAFRDVGKKWQDRIQLFCTPSLMTFCYMVCARINKEAADEYFRQICSGEGLMAGDPALVVRNRLMQINRARAPKAEVIFHGWNAFRRGGRLAIIRINGSLPTLV